MANPTDPRAERFRAQLDEPVSVTLRGARLSLVRRFTWTRLDPLQATTRHHLQTRRRGPVPAGQAPGRAQRRRRAHHHPRAPRAAC